MIHLTTAEKASRFDALQAAFIATKQTYDEFANGYKKRYESKQDTDILGAYEKGLSDAFTRMGTDIERWIV